MKGSIKLFLLSLVALVALADARVVKGVDNRKLAENDKNAAAVEEDNKGGGGADTSEEAVAVDNTKNAADTSTQGVAVTQDAADTSESATETAITEEMMAYAVPAPEDSAFAQGTYDYASNDAEKNKYDSKYESGSGVFADNTMGYCALDKLSEIQEVERLLSTNVQNVNLFLSDGSAISPLSDLISLTKDYLPSELKSSFTDQQILSVVMIQGLTGPQKTLTMACASAINQAFLDSLTVFNKLMGVGSAFNPSVGDAALATPTNTLTVLLNIINMNTDTFTKFRDVMLTTYDVFTVPLSPTVMSHKYFNLDWLKATATWSELALSPVSIVAKFAAVHLANAVQIQSAFNSGGDAVKLQAVFDNALAVCNAPTEMPSAAPSLGPMSQNLNLAVIAVTDFTFDSLQALTMTDTWTKFRTTYPLRFFCLLQLRGFEASQLKIPTAFWNDTLATYKKVNADGGDTFKQSDYWDLCNLNAVAAKGVEIIPLFVDTAAGVGASTALLQSTAAGRQMRVITAPNDGTSNWISPFIRDFAIT